MMNDKIAQIKTFVNENITNDVLKKVGISAIIFFIVIVAQLLIGAVVGVIDSIPVVNQLLMLVGLISVVNFTRNNVLSQEQRKEFVEKVQNIYVEVFG